MIRKTVLLFAMCILACAANAQEQNLAAPKPFVLGETRELWSKELGEKRVVNIYLPEGYSPGDTTRYPVIYLLDGGADEDFIHIVGLVQYNTFSWINRVPRSIVVGIANTDRKRDMTFPSSIAGDRKLCPTSGGSARFMAFLEKDLQPFIQKTYHTSATKTLIGESLGGLLAAEVLFTHPALFDKYIIISPSLWWDDGSLLKRSPAILQKDYTHPTDIYIGCGKEGLGLGKTPHVMEVDANVLADKIKETKSNAVKVYFDYLPAETHATVEHPAVFNAFRLLYPVGKVHSVWFCLTVRILYYTDKAIVLFTFLFHNFVLCYRRLE